MQVASASRTNGFLSPPISLVAGAHAVGPGPFLERPPCRLALHQRHRHCRRLLHHHRARQGNDEGEDAASAKSIAGFKAVGLAAGELVA